MTAQDGDTREANRLKGSGTAQGSGDTSEEQPDQRAASLPKGWPLWMWPPLAITLIAVAGDILGIAGALTTAVATLTTLVFVAGDILFAGQRRRALAILAVGVGAVVLTGLLWQAKVPWMRLPVTTQTGTEGPADLRGTTLTQAQVADLDLRGAQLSGAVLDGLNLHRKQMEGMVAAGASFRRADLSYASLRGADLNGANLSYACLIGIDFSGALLNGADVNNAIFDVHSLPLSVVKKLTGVPISPRPNQAGCR